MKIEEVKTAKDRFDFIQLPVKLYAGNKEWIRPLDKDIESVFNAKTNRYFRHGVCTRWILRGEKGEVIGRVAAFINYKSSQKEKQPTGGLGFFECVDSQPAADMLFDTCREWLKQQGMEAMDGPINFGERDSWWGLIVEGFHAPLYRMNFNPPYYQMLFENYGFQDYYRQFCYAMKVNTRLQEKFYERHKNIAGTGEYSAQHIRKNELGKFAHDFATIYNAAWASHGGGKTLEEKQVLTFFNKMKPVMDEKVAWFVYYKGNPVACWVNLPDLNYIIKHFKGRFGFFEKLKLIWMVRRRKTPRCIGLIFGIIPGHQGIGVDSYMIVEGAKIIQGQKLYEDFEMQWIGDFNPKMINIAESLGTTKSRTLITYRYLFNRQTQFERHPVLK